MMHAEVDVFISNYTIVDTEIYQLWVDGCSSMEAVGVLNQCGITQDTGTSPDLVASDVLDHYRTYNLLEKLLHNPPKLAEQLAFQIEPQSRQILIDKITDLVLKVVECYSPNRKQFVCVNSQLSKVAKYHDNIKTALQHCLPSQEAALYEDMEKLVIKYYAIDGIVIREFLGKKLSSRHRKDLDEVSEKTGISLRSCRRQFDNMKRVFKAVEELQRSVVINVQTKFMLPKELARNYGSVVFMTLMRFETGKRKLQYLTFQDFCECAESMMASWTYPPGNQDYDDTDLNREFLLDLRELRFLLDKEKEHKHLVCSRLKSSLLERSYLELELNFRALSRAIVGLGCNLHRSRELRTLFLDLVERVLEPWKVVSCSKTDLKHFLFAFTQCAIEMDVLREADVKPAWERYMTVITKCLLQMHH